MADVHRKPGYGLSGSVFGCSAINRIAGSGKYMCKLFLGDFSFVVSGLGDLEGGWGVDKILVAVGRRACFYLAVTERTSARRFPALRT